MSFHTYNTIVCDGLQFFTRIPVAYEILHKLYIAIYQLMKLTTILRL